MIKEISAASIPPKRGTSATTKKVMQEFMILSRRLEAKELNPGEALTVSLDDVEFKKATSQKSAMNKILKMTKAFVAEKRFGYSVYTRHDGNHRQNLYVANLAA